MNLKNVLSIYVMMAFSYKCGFTCVPGALTRLIGESALIFFFSMEQMVDTKFRALLDHSLMLLRKKWLYGILDDFVTKQLPNNVTWGLSLLYALEHKGDRALVSTQGEDLFHSIVVQTSVTTFPQQYLSS